MRPSRITASGAWSQEALARPDLRIGSLMAELTMLDLAETTLGILMADDGPMTHHGPPGSRPQAGVFAPAG